MGDKVMTPTRDELLNELVNELYEPEPPENGITVRMLCERSNKVEKTCREHLEKRVKQGTMAVVMIRHTKWYYVIK